MVLIALWVVLVRTLRFLIQNAPLPSSTSLWLDYHHEDLKRLDNGDIYFGVSQVDSLGHYRLPRRQLEETGEVLTLPRKLHTTSVDYGRELFSLLSKKYKSKVGCPEEEKYEAFSNEVRGERDSLLKEDRLDPDS